MSNVFIAELNKYKIMIDNIIENELLEMFTQDNIFSFMNKYYTAFRDFSKGGKRIRAYLVKLGYEMSGALDNKIIIPSLSYEIFQSGILIHDDIIDKSDLRRNMPSMHNQLGAGHLGVSKAICTGDIGLYFAIKLIAYSDFDAKIINEAIRHQLKVFDITISGELKDIELSVCDSYVLSDVFDMYKLKTSWYTITGPLQLGIIMGNLNSTLLNQIEEIGDLMGIAFQIKDDYLGILSNKEKIGKSNLSDMQEGKKTILTRHFLDHASQKQESTFNEIYGNNDSSDEQLFTLQHLFSETKTFEYADTMCSQYVERAANKINILSIEEKYKTILLDMLKYLSSREY